jgi:5-deoxy-glucuronate isomerase
MRGTTMSTLLVKPGPPDADGRVLAVTPESAGWRYVGFEVFRLVPGVGVGRHVSDRETCIVILSGHVHLGAGGNEWHGDRESVFDGPPTAIYVPPGIAWTAGGHGEIAVCTAPATTGAELRLLGVRHESRGEGGESREIAHILMEDEPAESLLVTEVITPAGHWSSYPPHKHDTDDPPRETYLEETYYHRMRQPGGFAFQRVYTADRALDESLAPADGDVVLVPRGFHPVSAGARHDLYYLNVMAGPIREWRITGDPDYA